MTEITSSLTLPAVTDEGDQLPDTGFLEQLNIWYEEAHGFHVWNGSQFVEMSEGALKQFLKTKRVRTNSRGGASPMDHALTDIRLKRNVAYVGPLAGKSAGIHEENGQRVLVLGGPKLIQADPTADWSFLREIIEGLLAPGGGVQVPYFYSWLKVAHQALNVSAYAPGQALALAGPRDCGKTLLQTVIVAILGGRTANPYAFLSGGTQFNRDLFRAETLIFGDEIGSTDIRVRRTIGSRLKQITVNQDQWCHGKGREAVTLRPQWRVCLSLNDETENLMVLPPMDDSIEDKLMLLRTSRPALLDDPNRWSNDRSADWSKISTGLPGLVAFLQKWEIPGEIRSGRFGVMAYHDPDLMVALQSISPETRLLDLIDAADLFKSSTTQIKGPGELVQSEKEYWEGSSVDLEKRLLSEGSERIIRDSTSRLLTFNSAMGTYLGRLAKKCPRVNCKTVHGQKIWRISRKNERHQG